MSIHISLTFKAREIFVFLHWWYDLQSRRSCCCLGNPGKNLGFWSFISDDWFQVLEVLHCFYPLTFYLDLSLEAVWVVCHHFHLTWTYLHFIPRGGFIFLFCIYDNLIYKAEVGDNPLSATISSACGWSLFRMVFNKTLLGWPLACM